MVLWGGIIFLALRFLARDVFRYFGFDEATFGRFWTHRICCLGRLDLAVVCCRGSAAVETDRPAADLMLIATDRIQRSNKIWRQEMGCIL